MTGASSTKGGGESRNDVGEAGVSLTVVSPGSHVEGFGQCSEGNEEPPKGSE